jgi:hypothetical protein
MCWNEDISWLTFIVGTLSNIFFVIKKKDINYTLLSLVLQTPLFVQLGEAYIWKDINNNCGYYSKLGSIITFFSVYLQPFLSYLYLYNAYERIILFEIILIIYFILLIYNFSNIEFCNKPEKSTCDNKLHVNSKTWENVGLVKPLYIISISYALILLTQYNSKLTPLSIYLFVSMILSKLYYKDYFASTWCFFSTITPYILYKIY